MHSPHEVFISLLLSEHSLMLFRLTLLSLFPYRTLEGSQELKISGKIRHLLFFFFQNLKLKFIFYNIKKKETLTHLKSGLSAASEQVPVLLCNQEFSREL